LANGSDWPRVATYFQLAQSGIVSHLFAVPTSLSWVLLKKSKKLNLDVRNIFAWSHTKKRREFAHGTDTSKSCTKRKFDFHLCNEFSSFLQKQTMKKKKKLLLIGQ
jgi:hypothetical protein